MAILNKLIMMSLAVSDMDVSKEFYEKTMGFTVISDYGQGDNHWVSTKLPNDDFTITLTTNHENMKLGTMKLYVSAPDIESAHTQLKSKGANDIADDLYGPGSGVKWFSINDPDKNNWLVVQSK